MRRNNLITEKHRPSGVSRRIHTRDANGKKQSFDYIPNLPKYNKNLNFRQASKFQRINARPIENPNGEDIDTVLKDGTIERKGLHLPQGYYDVNNVGGSEHWGIDPKTFAKKYEADPEQSGVYKPKGGPMLASNPLKRNVSFQAPWGGRMDMKAGSRIMQDPNNPNDTYGIGGNEFDDTYKFNESKNMKKIIRLTEGDLHKIVKRSVNKILREFGSDGPDFDDAYDENFDINFDNEFGSQRFGHVDSINDSDFASNDDFLNFGSDKPFYDDEDDIDLPNLRNESRRRNGRRQRVLTEGLKTTNNANAVPEELARNCGFKLEYGGGEDGYEIWGRDIEPGSYGEELLRTLGIRKWDSWNVNGHVRITVKPEYGYSSEKWNAPRRKIGDYVDTEWADNGGRIFHNPKNGHFKREKF